MLTVNLFCTYGRFFWLCVFWGLKICEAHKTHIFQDNVEKILEQKGIRYIYNIFFAELWGAIFRGVMINFSFWLRRQLVDKKCHIGHCNILYHFMIHHGLQKRANFFSFKCCFRDKWSLINNGSKSLLNQLLIWLCICKFRR